MSAHDQIRAMLDQLMGTARNGDDDKIKVDFDDPRVCKPFLLGCCQYELLGPTRLDLGECPKIHNLALKADYERGSKDNDYFFYLEAMEQLGAFVADADQKTEQARKRLAETQEGISAEVEEKADKVHELAERIAESLTKAEKLGVEGLVDESMKLMDEIDNLRKQKSEAHAEYRRSIPAATYQRQSLRVCEVCGSYLGIHDNDRRLADHFGGKLHLGFIKVRDTLKNFQAISEERRRNRLDSLRNRKAMEDEEMEKERGRRRRSRSKGKDKDSRSSKKKDASHSRSKEMRDRCRSRSRERRSGDKKQGTSERKEKDRSRSRYKKRSRSKSRDRRSRHKLRSRSCSSSPKKQPWTTSVSEKEPGEI